jgi:hypothetical protein
VHEGAGLTKCDRFYSSAERALNQTREKIKTLKLRSEEERSLQETNRKQIA